MSTISQFRLAKTVNTAVDFGISLPSDKGMSPPALGTHCHSSSQRLRTVGESEIHFVETNCKSSCMVLMGSILCQYYKTSCYFPSHVVHAVLVQRVYQQPCNGLAWDESSPPAHQLHQSGSDTWVSAADQPLSTLANKLHWKYPQTEHGEDSYQVALGQYTLRRCCVLFLVTGWTVVAGLQHSLKVVSRLVTKLNLTPVAPDLQN